MNDRSFPILFSDQSVIIIHDGKRYSNENISPVAGLCSRRGTVCLQSDIQPMAQEHNFKTLSRRTGYLQESLFCAKMMLLG